MPQCRRRARIKLQRQQESSLSGPNLDPSRRAPDPEAAQRNQLAQALQRARMAIAWERLWPNLARVLTVTGLFLAASWAGAWVALPLFARIAGLVLFAALTQAA
jgi:hypothetical protein